MAIQVKTTKDVPRGNLVLVVNEADGEVIGAFLRKLDSMHELPGCTLGAIDNVLKLAPEIDLQKQELDIIKKKEGTADQKKARETVIDAHP
jgi:hypothetical protein